MCWGRTRGSEDGECVGERERLLDCNGKIDEQRWDSDEETEFEEEEGEDERLMGVGRDGKGHVGEGADGKRWKGILRGVRKCSRWT